MITKVYKGCIMSNLKLKNHELRVDRAFAQGDVSQVKKTLVRVINGERVVTKIKVNSPNQERMNDALVGYFQNKVKGSFDYFKYRKEALNILESKFKEHKLNISNLPYKEKRIRAAAIQQVVDENILNQFSDNPRMDVDFDEIIKLAKLKSALSFKGQAEVLLSVTGRGVREVKRDVIDLDSMVIKETIYKKRIEIIGIDIVLDEEIGQFFPMIEDFINADINPLNNKKFKNKRKYVKKVGVIFSKDVLPHIVCQGIDYVALDPSIRQKFSLQNTYAIDTYITSIQHAQEYRQLTDFTPENLQKKFGHSYNRFDRYLKNIIEPCIKDFNKNDHRILSYILKRKGYEWGDENAQNSKSTIEKFRWIVTDYEKSIRNDIESSHFYIALKILSLDEELKNKFSSIKAFAISVSEQLQSDIPNLTVISGKTISEWLKEAKYELECEEKILEIFKYSNITDILYDRDTMSLISSKFNVENINFPSQCLEYLKNTLKINEPRRKLIKKISYPSNDVKFIEEVLTSAKLLKFNNILHFYFSFSYFYKNKDIKNKDWKSTANLWLTNGRYDSITSREFSFEFIYENNVYLGVWNQEDEIIETEELEFEDVDISVLANFIADDSIKPIGFME